MVTTLSQVAHSVEQAAVQVVLFAADYCVYVGGGAFLVWLLWRFFPRAG